MLCVDDDEFLLRLLDRVLRKLLSADVRCFADPIAAAESLASGATPHAVVVDARMPAMDGYEFCRRVRAMPQLESVPILFLTGGDVLEISQRAKDAGATVCLQKPFKPAVIAELIRSLTADADGEKQP